MLYKSDNDGITNVKIAILLKYFCNFWRTLDMPLVYCKISFILTWSAICINFEDNRITIFKITDSNLYVPAVTLSTQENVNLGQKLKPALKEQLTEININQKYQ